MASIRESSSWTASSSLLLAMVEMVVDYYLLDQVVKSTGLV